MPSRAALAPVSPVCCSRVYSTPPAHPRSACVSCCEFLRCQSLAARLHPNPAHPTPAPARLRRALLCAAAAHTAPPARAPTAAAAHLRPGPSAALELAPLRAPPCRPEPPCAPVSSRRSRTPPARLHSPACTRSLLPPAALRAARLLAPRSARATAARLCRRSAPLCTSRHAAARARPASPSARARHRAPPPPLALPPGAGPSALYQWREERGRGKEEFC
jgi:hypothetical protein